MPAYLVRLAQIHESFRVAELRALAELAGVQGAMEIVRYDDDSPYCIVHLPSEAAARQLASRALLIQGIYELWGQGGTYDELHANVRETTSHLWTGYETCSFSFRIERYRGVQASPEHTRRTIESFSFLGFRGKVEIKRPEASFRVFEEYGLDAQTPRAVFLGRWIADSGREARHKYDLKKRHYISTTSMDAELALLTANIARAAPGKLFYDPFMGTGGFPLACAYFGAVVTGSDIDGRSIRGTGGSARRGQTGAKNVLMNFQQYGTADRYLGAFVGDLTNAPLRDAQFLDGIVCDPPYGIREGLKVLGSRTALEPEQKEHHAKQHRVEGYIPPKRPYSFTALLDDIVAFAVRSLVTGGSLSMWIPSANDEDGELRIPTHPCLGLESVCTQRFNKWSRRLVTWRRLSAREVGGEWQRREYESGTRASELNEFRRKYFEGFREFEDMKKEFIRMKAGGDEVRVESAKVGEEVEQ